MVRIGPYVFPIEALNERMLGGVPPTPRLEGRLPEVDVGYALALHVDGIAAHLYCPIDTLKLPGEVTYHPLPLRRQHHVPIPLQRIARPYVRKRPVVEVGQAVHRVRVGPQ